MREINDDALSPGSEGNVPRNQDRVPSDTADHRRFGVGAVFIIPLKASRPIATSYHDVPGFRNHQCLPGTGRPIGCWRTVNANNLFTTATFGLDDATIPISAASVRGRTDGARNVMATVRLDF
jgi:hypothetical protein